MSVRDETSEGFLQNLPALLFWSHEINVTLRNEEGKSQKTLSTRQGLVESTCVFGPLQDGRDLVALLGFADAVAGRRAHADGVQVGLHPAQKGGGGGGAVGDLEVHAVGLRGSADAASAVRRATGGVRKDK